jgi:hypothetical protein
MSGVNTAPFVAAQAFGSNLCRALPSTLDSHPRETGFMTHAATAVDTQCINTIRTLAMDSEGNYQRQIFDYQIKASADVTAPTVTVSPAAGSYTSAQSVAFTVKDDTDSAPKLYYTTDGTSATASSTLYTGAITVSKSTTINTYAVDATGNHVSASYSYVIDDNNVGDGYLLDEYGATGIAAAQPGVLPTAGGGRCPVAHCWLSARCIRSLPHPLSR